jgi:AbiV family abortive infection protein
MDKLQFNQQLEKVVTHCISNAEQLIDDARTLSIKGSHGHALALSILAREEIMKALAFFCMRIGLIGTSREALRELREHKIKHMLEKNYVFLSMTLGNLLEGIVLAGKDMEARRKHFDNWETRMKNTGIEGTPESRQMQEAIDEAESLDALKQKGLYIDWYPGTLSLPQDVQEKETSKSIQKARDRLDAVKTLQELMNNPSTMKQIEELASELKRFMYDWRRKHIASRSC